MIVVQFSERQAAALADFIDRCVHLGLKFEVSTIMGGWNVLIEI